MTVVTPSFNQGHFIEDTILSIKNQNYPNIEHLIIDGGSNDDTLNVIKKYEKTYNMRWISEPDEGQSNAINKGIRMADGQIIGWLNSDDVYFSSETISYVVQQFANYENARVIFGDDVLIDKNKNFLFKRTMRDFDYQIMLKKNIISQPATFFLKEVVVDNLLDEKLHFAMDYELWLRLYNRGYKFIYVNKILASNRIHGQRKMIVGKSEAELEVKRILENIQAIKSRNNTITGKIINKINHLFCRLLGVKALCLLKFSDDSITGMKPEKLNVLLREQLFMTSYRKILKD